MTRDFFSKSIRAHNKNKGVTRYEGKNEGFNYRKNCSYGCTPGNKSEFLASRHLTEEEFQENPTINWDAIIWVNRPLELWFIQLILAMVSLTEALLLAYLGYKVRIIYQYLTA